MQCVQRPQTLLQQGLQLLLSAQMAERDLLPLLLQRTLDLFSSSMREVVSTWVRRETRSTYWLIFDCMLSTWACSLSRAVFSSNTPVSTAVISGGSDDVGSKNFMTLEYIV